MNKKPGFLRLLSVVRAYLFYALLCFIPFNAYSVNVDSGRYITSGALPDWVNIYEYATQNDTGAMHYHGYGKSNDGSLAENTYATDFSYGRIYGDSACRQYGNWGEVTDETFDRGNQDNGWSCWCRLNGENDPSGSYSYKSKWVSRGAVDSGDCWRDCAEDCSQITGNIYRWGDGPKNALFSNVYVYTDECLENHYCPGGDITDGSNGMYSCPDNSSSGSGQSYCTCNSGYTTDGHSADGYNTITTSTPCIQERIHCSAGYYLEGGHTTCSPCAEGYYCEEDYYDPSGEDQGLKSCGNGYEPNSGQTGCVLIEIIYVSAGQYISSGALPSWVNWYEDAEYYNESLMHYNGFNNANDYSLAENTFAIEFGYGTLYGDSSCRPQDDPYGEWNTTTDWNFERGNQDGGWICWCRLNGANDPSGSYLYKSQWVSRGPIDDGQPCWENCAHDCALITGNIREWGNGPRISMLETTSLSIEDCPPGYYCPGGDMQAGDNGLRECPENSYSDWGQTYCTCNSGYTTDGEEPDSSNTTTTTTPCIPAKVTCPAGTYLKAGETICSTCKGNHYCVQNTYYPADWDQGLLTCDSGYVPNSDHTGCELYTTNPTNVGAGQYVSRYALPSWVDWYEDAEEGNASLIHYHGYDNTNDYSLPENTFAIEFDYGTLYGDSACRQYDNPYGEWNTTTDWDFDRGNQDGGSVCWCRLNGTNDSSGMYAYKSQWVARGAVDSGDCWRDCAYDCALITGNIYRWGDGPRMSMFDTSYLSVETCSAGYYCPGGTIPYGESGRYACPENSTSESGQTSCTCNIRYATENGEGATQDNPCVRLTGPASCITGEFWDIRTQSCLPETEKFEFATSYYMPPVYDTTQTGFFCHKSESASFCNDFSLINDLPYNSWLVQFEDFQGVTFYGRSSCSDIGGNYLDVSDVPFTSDRVDGSNCWCHLTSPFTTDKWIFAHSWEYEGDSGPGICSNECAGKCGWRFSDYYDFRNVMLSNIEVHTTICEAGYYCPGGEYSVLNTKPSHLKCPDNYPDSQDGSYSIEQCYAILSFEPNGGTAVASQTFNYDANTGTYSLSEIPVTTLSGHEFAGWFDNEELSGTPITTETRFAKSTTLYAKWADITCNEHQYLDTSSNTCKNCPDGYTLADNGATSAEQCYKPCTTANINHSLSVTGRDYYGGTDTCEAISCETGYKVKDGFNLMTTIGVSEVASNYTTNDYYGNYYDGGGNLSPDTSNSIIENDSMAFAVDYGEKGIIKGHGRCSTRSATNPWVGTDYAYVLQPDSAINNLTNETNPTNGGGNCYCHLDSYRPSDSANDIALSGSWIIHHDYRDGDACADDCGFICAYDMLDNDSYHASFRSAMFGVSPALATCEHENYNIMYNLDGGTLPDGVTNPTSYTIASENITINNPVREGYTFTGWTFETEPEAWGDGSSTDSNNIIIATGTRGNIALTANWNVMCTADEIIYVDSNTQQTTCVPSAFEVTTTPDTQNFVFHMSVSGTYYVDWGDGNVDKFTRSTSTAISDTNKYSHDYDVAGEYVIRFARDETGPVVVYPSFPETWGHDRYISPISFGKVLDGDYADQETNTYLNVAKISGSLGKMFPLHPTLHTHPRYFWAFRGCSNLYGEIPENLFRNTDDPNVTGEYADGVPTMFLGTFADCPRLGTEKVGDEYVPTYGIPRKLFHGITAATQSTFYETFSGCSGLTGKLPSDLFATIQYAYSASGAFYRTFALCSSLQGFEPGFNFGNLTGSAGKSMFYGTFVNCKNLSGYLPAGMFGNMTGDAAPYMFMSTFSGCSSLQGFEPGFKFGSFTGNTADGMFMATFYECTNLGGDLPADTFGNMTGNASEYMFYQTFFKSNLTGLAPGFKFGSFTGDAALNMFYGTFMNNKNLSGYLPADMFGNMTKSADYMFYGTFVNTAIQGFEPGFTFGSFTGDASPYMFRGTFNNCPNLATKIPAGIFGDMSGKAADRMFNFTFSKSAIQGFEPGFKFGSFTGDAATYMYRTTFKTSGLKELPTAEQFGNFNNAKPAENMFEGTFEDCPELTGPIPEDLFSGFSGAPATKMFTGTFKGDALLTGFSNGKTYISPDYMSGITEEGYSRGPMTDMFTGTGLRESCPEDTYEIEKFDNDWLPKVVCDGCGDVYPHSDEDDNGPHEKCYAKVTFVSNDGTEDIQDRYTWSADHTDSYSVVLPTLSDREGFVFLGWTEEEHLGGALVDETNNHFTGDIVLSAKWASEAYDIEYVMNGGTNYEGAPDTYSYGVGATIDGTPTRYSFKFKGWCTNEELTDCYENGYVIPEDATGTQTLYAKWEFECVSGKWYHIGDNEDDKICLYTDKVSPSMVVALSGSTPLYLHLTTDENTKINNKSNLKLRVEFNGNTYNAYDESVNQ